MPKTTPTFTVERIRWRRGRRMPTSRLAKKCVPSRGFVGQGNRFCSWHDEGINLVAQTYGRKFLQPGDEIVLSTLEHHANIVPWQIGRQGERRGAADHSRQRSRGSDLGRIPAATRPRTKIVALSQASNSLGTILPRR